MYPEDCVARNIILYKLKSNFSLLIYIFVYRRTRGTGTPMMPTQLCSAVRQVFTRFRRRRSGSSRFVLSYETSLMQRAVFKRTIFHALFKSTDSEYGLCYTKYYALLRATGSECGLCYTKYHALLKSLPGNIVSSVSDAKI